MEPSILDYYNEYPSMISIIDKLNEENNKLREELNSTKDDLDFYKSIFKTHSNSVLFNLFIKYKNGKRLWIDKIRTGYHELNKLDIDEDIKNWLKPVRCER